MYWFLMTSTKYWSGFGTVPPPMIKAVRSGDELLPQFGSSASATPGGSHGREAYAQRDAPTPRCDR